MLQDKQRRASRSPEPPPPSKPPNRHGGYPLKLNTSFPTSWVTCSWDFAHWREKTTQAIRPLCAGEWGYVFCSKAFANLMLHAFFFLCTGRSRNGQRKYQLNQLWGALTKLESTKYSPSWLNFPKLILCNSRCFSRVILTQTPSKEFWACNSSVILRRWCIMSPVAQHLWAECKIISINNIVSNADVIVCVRVALRVFAGKFFSKQNRVRVIIACHG